ncbi:MAG: ribosome assembly cofactor RimP [Bacteroidales bacterium]|nr:ribosome assembly cofactor RimP [Bacteroidales bacterium]
MITVDTVGKIVEAKLAEDGVFVVELTVSADNSIRLVVDKKEGVDIDYCVTLTRMIEEALDRDVEDYDLEVSSAGIGCELKVLGQFEKNLGNEVEVTYANGSHKKGILTAADAEGFEVDIEEKIVVEGAKKKQTVTNHYRYAYNEVKLVKDVISFK